jgi:hypothetical protein
MHKQQTQMTCLSISLPLLPAKMRHARKRKPTQNDRDTYTQSR